MGRSRNSRSRPTGAGSRTGRSKARPLGRRDFLKLLAGSVAGAGLLSVPLPRWTLQAQESGTRTADRLLILNCFGGIRSSAAFHASAQREYNPWGLMEGTGQLRLGALLGDAVTDPAVAPLGVAESPLPDAAYELGPDWGNARLPRLAEAAAGFSVVGTWNERRGDHVTSQIEETTGGDRSEPGLLTRVNMALAEANGLVDVPSFAINVAQSVLFGVAPGPTAPHAPVELENRRDLPGQSHLPAELLERVGDRWAGNTGGAGGVGAFDRLDRLAVDQLAGSNRLLAEAHASQRRNQVRLGSRLAEPWLDLENAPAAFGEVTVGDASRPLTNQMLAELFLRGLGPDPMDPERSRPLAPDQLDMNPYVLDAYNLALGVRLLQLGAPVVVVEIENFDLHSAERSLGPGRYRTLGRFWSSLWWLLSRLGDPGNPSQPMLDRTLVVTTSEFGRDPAGVNGFNDGEGSDHGAFPSCYYLAHALMGAGVGGGRLIAGVETDGSGAYDARSADERYDTHQFLASLMYALGLDHTSNDYGFPGSGGPITRLWGSS